jgi:hypothetical protein
MCSISVHFYKVMALYIYIYIYIYSFMVVFCKIYHAVIFHFLFSRFNLSFNKGFYNPDPPRKRTAPFGPKTT